MSRFSFLKEIFSGKRAVSDEEQNKLFGELLFLTLSRASRSDLDISAVEIATIQRILKEKAGLDVGEKDIRTAGMSRLYEVASLDKYVAKAAKNLSVEKRYTVLSSLYEVIGADDNFGHTEADFFDSIAHALRLRPIEMMGVVIDID